MAATQGTRRKDATHEGKETMMRLVLGGLAYLVPTFALGFVWHLVLFERNYAALAMYRSDIIIPLGFLSMLIQAVIFAWIYQQLFARRSGMLMSRALLYGVLGAALSWSFTTLAVAAKKRHGISTRLSPDRDGVHGRAMDHGRAADRTGLWSTTSMASFRPRKVQAESAFQQILTNVRNSAR
jgi:hypothetical protein